ncbi:ubiquitin-2 like Rad60 SUMO-like-domain-containing protein [Leucosporidium creatinivorum]|uniref:Ubiquitin-2 like Rad60 SUMO-like-domain-containing protein n=1 Tax=Leucosporidium creatinivorum TaxID=106004 RepID=A0A1Y2FXE8_9BASI|nr:ubiquitin-2 like Rad60 SUMO-like-domain-containing protein [Leucosporidium creatinivorum]
MSDSEQQPEVKPENVHVALKISGSGFPDLLIKVKKTTKLSKMMSAYCERAGKSLGEVRFMFDGERLRPEQTVGELDIDDDDDEVLIEVASEAVGGSC